MKVDEESLFPLSSINYYVPGINIKYPYTYGQYYKRNFIDSSLDSDKIISMYEQNEVYIFDVASKSMLSNLGTIAIDS